MIDPTKKSAPQQEVDYVLTIMIVLAKTSANISRNMTLVINSPENILMCHLIRQTGYALS